MSSAVLHRGRPYVRVDAGLARGNHRIENVGGQVVCFGCKIRDPRDTSTLLVPALTGFRAKQAHEHMHEINDLVRELVPA